MKIIAFAASSSSQSINKKLVTYAASLLDGVEIEILDLNDFELPLFSEDREKELGQPELAKAFFEKLGQSDGILISFAEHNGSYSAAYKNLLDWCSRISGQVFQNKPMVILATSPGERGGANVLSVAVDSAPRFAGDVRGSLSLPSFYENFDVENGRISNDEINTQLVTILNKLL